MLSPHDENIAQLLEADTHSENREIGFDFPIPQPKNEMPAFNLVGRAIPKFIYLQIEVITT